MLDLVFHIIAFVSLGDRGCAILSSLVWVPARVSCSTTHVFIIVCRLLNCIRPLQFFNRFQI